MWKGAVTWGFFNFFFSFYELRLLRKLRRLFPDAEIKGHRDLPNVKKDCPCFDAAAEYAGI